MLILLLKLILIIIDYMLFKFYILQKIMKCFQLDMIKNYKVIKKLKKKYLLI